LWTRPPTFRGFSLGDSWAFLRYGTAIASTPGLQLRSEWTDVDAHQKTILSDEMGVGAVTCLLASHVGCLDFVDTNYALKTLKFPFSRGRSKKRGPSKSPDYIARLPGGRFLVVECKGTQTSRKALRSALGDGVAQKRNLTATASARVYASLVGGLFIPQSTSSEDALIEFCDPEWAEVEGFLVERDPVVLAGAAVQIAAAKGLSLACNAAASRLLGETVFQDLDDAGGRFRAAVQAGAPAALQTLWPYVGDDGTPAAIETRVDAGALVESLRGPSLQENLVRLAEESSGNNWTVEESENRFEAVTPLGLHIVVERIA
jgi:hypothetical protein